MQVASGQKLYFSYAKAQREPNRTDYENGTPKPEKLDDFELGWRIKHQNSKPKPMCIGWSIKTNWF